MAKRVSTEEQLATLRRLRGAPGSEGAERELGVVLGCRPIHGLVVKGAAELAVREGARGLAGALVAAAEGLVGVEGVKRDPGCGGKEAVLRALLEWEVDVPAFYVKAAGWVQREPVQKGTKDTAAECRGLAAVGVAMTRPAEALEVMVDVLADGEEAARVYGAMALGLWRGTEAVPVLRLKARTGDASAEVMGETLGALLKQDLRGQAGFVEGFLGDEDTGRVEAAALALGRSRAEGALVPLTGAFMRYQRHPIRTSLLLAIAQLRSEASVEWFCGQLARAPAGLGTDLLEALRMYRGDARVTERLRALAGRHEETAGVFRELFE